MIKHKFGRICTLLPFSMTKHFSLLVFIIVFFSPSLLIAQIVRVQVFHGQQKEWNRLNNKGMDLVRAAKYDQALPVLQEAKEKALIAFGGDHQSYGLSLSNLALAYYNLGKYSNAEVLFLEANEIFTKKYGKDHDEYAKSIQNLAMIYAVRGNYSMADSLITEAHEVISKLVLGKRLIRYKYKDDAYCAIIANQASIYNTMGFYSKAEPLFIESMNFRVKIEGEKSIGYANILSRLAGLYINMGKYSKAEPMFMESKAIVENVQSKGHPSYAQSLINIASFYMVVGNYSKSESLFMESNEIIRKVLGREHPAYATSLYGLGSLYTVTGNFSKAEPLLLEAQEIYAKVWGKKGIEYATLLNRLGSLYYRMDNYPKAEALFTESKGIWETVLGREQPDYANSLSNLALIKEAMGNYSTAEMLFIEAHSIYKNTLGEDHPDYITAVSNLALLYKQIGNYSKADTLFLESISGIQKQIARYFPSLSEKEKELYYSKLHPYLTSFQSYCLDRYIQSPAIIASLYNLQLAIKGLLFNTTIKVNQRILDSKNKKLIDAYYGWKSRKDFLAKVYQMPPNEKKEKGIDEKLLEEDVNVLEKWLSLQSELFVALEDQKQFKWEDIKQKLNQGEASIEILRATKKINKTKVPVYIIIMVTSQTEHQPELIVLSDGDDLDNKFYNYYRNAITQKVRDEISYNQYWKPIADRLKGIKKVFVSADGVYNQINLNTLYNSATGKYILDEMEVQIVTSTKDLLTNNKRANSKINNTTLFGYPNFNNSKPSKPDSTRSVLFPSIPKADEIKSDSSQRFLNGDNISELPGTKVEVETIRAFLKNKSISIHEYLFDAATEAEVKRLNNPQVLHIATHGFFLSDLKESDENGRGFVGMETKKFVENPLLRSGLLFAGVKDAFATREIWSVSKTEDGILTAYEAMNLDLDQTDLVVMSACETGLGVTSNGEGVYGLQRAFQVAGAKSVMMSLWRVSDEATQQLMTSFYEKWLAGNTPRDAFRKAQLSLREKYPEPYYWGAFVLVGE